MFVNRYNLLYYYIIYVLKCTSGLNLQIYGLKDKINKINTVQKYKMTFLDITNLYISI